MQTTTHRGTPDLSGQRFGRLRVICLAAGPSPKYAYYYCVCDCGNKQVVRKDDLKSGKKLSCGCLLAEKQKKLGERSKVAQQQRKALNSAAYAAAYRIIAALAGESGCLDDPSVRAALDYFQAASDGDVQDTDKILPFRLRNETVA